MENNKTFEEALTNLEQIVKELESGSVDLDNAIKKYSEAMGLAKFCSDKIKNATAAVNKVLTESGELKDLDIKENN